MKRIYIPLIALLVLLSLMLGGVVALRLADWPDATTAPLSDILAGKYTDAEAQSALATIPPDSLPRIPDGWVVDCVDAHHPVYTSNVKQFCRDGVWNTPTPISTPTSGSPTVTIPPTNTPRTVTPSETPTATYTPSSTPTRRPTFTKTPTATATEVDDPTPLPETLDPNEPTPESGEKECAVKVIESSGLIVRSGPARSNTRVGSVPYASYLKVDTFATGSFEGKPELWAHIYDGWVVVRYNNVWWIGGISGLTEMCLDVQGWPADLVPPADVVRNPAGLHTLGFSVNSYAVLSVIRSFGLLKGTDDFYYLASQAKALNPDLITVHRNVFLVEIGRRDCPDEWGRGDPVMVAREWWRLQYATWKARGLLEPGPVDYYEYRNECQHKGAWEVAFDREIIRLANAAGMCLALMSYSYGQPELDQFAGLKPVFDDVLAKTCQDGRYHAVALHTYGRVDSGAYIFGRWRLFRQALGKEYDWLFYLFSEMGVTNSAGANDGRGSADCGVAAKETAELVAEFRKSPEVLGFGLYSVGGSTEWLDLTPCLPQIAAALQ